MSQTPLPLRDTARVYGLVTRALHWSIAGLVLWQFLGMGLKLIFGREPFVSNFVGSHQPVGTLLFVLIVLRLGWALANRSNRPAAAGGLMGLAAKAGHGLLYLVMLIVPLAALARSFGNERAFAPFGFTIFPAREQPIEWMVAFGNALHGELAWVLGVMILGHIVMAALHEAMWRDGTLAKMIGRKALR